ncbi:hypothetical protein JW906_10915 [bacterium]|nr:hypothetical protein [bacterium]
MNLITLTFEIHEEDVNLMIQRLSVLKASFREEAMDLSLYQSSSQKTRFTMMIQTDKTADDIAQFIQAHPEARSFFESVKDSTGRMVLSFLERRI